jgi:hypothetical protein
VEVLSGAATACGHVLRAGAPAVRLYSPTTHALVTLAAVPRALHDSLPKPPKRLAPLPAPAAALWGSAEDMWDAVLLLRAPPPGDPALVPALASAFQPRPVRPTWHMFCRRQCVRRLTQVVGRVGRDVRRTCCPALRCRWHVVRTGVAPHMAVAEGWGGVGWGGGAGRVGGLVQVIAPIVDVPALTVPPLWATALEASVTATVGASASSLSGVAVAAAAAPVWLLAGPKSAGKSTLGRLLVNRALATCVPLVHCPLSVSCSLTRHTNA